MELSPALDAPPGAGGTSEPRWAGTDPADAASAAFAAVLATLVAAAAPLPPAPSPAADAAASPAGRTGDAPAYAPAPPLLPPGLALPNALHAAPAAAEAQHEGEVEPGVATNPAPGGDARREAASREGHVATVLPPLGVDRPVAPPPSLPSATPAAAPPAERPEPAPAGAVAPPASPATIAGPDGAAIPEAVARPGAPSPPAAQVVRVVAPLRRLADGRHDLVLELRPAELGAVRVELSLDGGVVHLGLRAELEGTGQLLRSAIPELRHQLEAAGVHAGRVAVDAGQGGRAGEREPWRSEPDADDGRPAAGRDAVDALPEDLVTTAYPSSADGRVDVLL